MNPGPIEEAGQTARSFFETMREQPAVLALIMCNIALLVFIFYALFKAGEFRDNLITSQFTYQREISALLSKCVVPKEGDLKWHGEEGKQHSSVTPSKSSSSTYTALISQAGNLQGWYCTTPLPQHSISGGTVGPPLKLE